MASASPHHWAEINNNNYKHISRQFAISEPNLAVNLANLCYVERKLAPPEGASTQEVPDPDWELNPLPVTWQRCTAVHCYVISQSYKFAWKACFCSLAHLQYPQKYSCKKQHLEQSESVGVARVMPRL